MAKGSPAHTDGVGFLLARLGHHAASLFADQMATLELTLTQAGILRAVAATPGRSQHDLSAYLGVMPGRLVAHVDELEQRGYLERRRDAGDRRRNALHLTEAGKQLMRRLSCLMRQHESQLMAGLDPDECDTLHALLAAVARHRGLMPHANSGSRAGWVVNPAV
jgi:DNA-binding MarR family transcriptional regulator